MLSLENSKGFDLLKSDLHLGTDIWSRWLLGVLETI